MKRLPVLAMILVGAACAVMIALGLWQLRRADEKAALLAQYQAAANLPAMRFPLVADPKALPLFRKAGGFCLRPGDWRTKAGRNMEQEAGWVHIVQCASGAEGPGFAVEAGWSRFPKPPVWQGGPVRGVITSDDASLIRLVSDVPLAPELERSSPPSMESIPNNHLSYAAQWFAFAAIALAIFGVALWRRRGQGDV